jgi:hypothetical protein
MRIDQKYFSLLLIAGLMVSCSRELGKEQKPKTDLPPPIIVNEPEVITYEVAEPVFAIAGDTEPHTYQVQVKWPKNPHPVSILVDRVTLARVLPTESNSFIFKVQDKKTYLVELFVENPEATKVLDVRKITIPTDYVFSSTEVLSKDSVTKANRVYFKKTSSIETKNFAFTIDADEIFFEEGAKIVNFKKFPKPEPQKDGLSGGIITIISRIAHGKVDIELNGSQGGKGVTAFPWGIPGPDGKKGSPAEAVDSMTRGCLKNPTNGEPAPDGNPGKTGFPGQKGGNSGQLTIEVAEQSEIEINHTENPGTGGEGGEGGKGQLPGQPGKAGDRDPTGVCPAASDGPATAKIGPPGNQGPPGPDGDYGTICINVGKGPNQCIKLN